MKLEGILELSYLAIVTLATSTTACNGIPSGRPDVKTYSSSSAYPRYAVTKELRQNPHSRWEMKRAIRKLPRRKKFGRKKREVDINQFFDENPDVRANRFLLRFMGFDMSSGGQALPIEEHLGPPIEISHDDFLALKNKHGDAAEGKVVQISENEFNELSRKHGVEVQPSVENVEIQTQTRRDPVDKNLPQIPIVEQSEWIPVKNKDRASIPFLSGKKRRRKTCTSSKNSISLKDKLIYRNTECWVIPSFRYRRFQYDLCSRRGCSSGSSVGCLPSVLKQYDIWLYCSSLSPKLQKYVLKLGQKCRCKQNC